MHAREWRLQPATPSPGGGEFLQNVSAPNGQINFADTNPLPGSGFYRLRYPALP